MGLRKWFGALVWGVGLAFIFTTVAFADVSGSFDLNAILLPEGTQTEAVKFALDLRSNVQLNITLSGMTLGVDSGFGNTGPEFSIVNLTTALGPIVLSNQIAFAVPFYNVTQAVNVTGRDLGPTVNSLGVNGLSFVKARLGIDFDVAGFTIENLAILEDVDFPNPFNYIQSAYFTEGLDNIIDIGGSGNINQTPTLGFGDVISVEGQTRNRVTVKGETGLCVQPEVNLIKGRSWPESVDPGCRGTVFFSYETLSISGLSVAGFDVSLDVTWTPEEPIEAKLKLETNLLDALDLTVHITSDNITKLSLARTMIELSTSELHFRLLDAGGDLMPEQLQATASFVLNPNQNPANFILFAILDFNLGLTFLESAFTVTRQSVSFQFSSVFQSAGNGSVTWQSARLGLNVALQPAVLSVSVLLSDRAMSETSISLGFAF